MKNADVRILKVQTGLGRSLTCSANESAQYLAKDVAVAREANDDDDDDEVL
jgi:hypothetical protein